MLNCTVVYILTLIYQAARDMGTSFSQRLSNISSFLLKMGTYSSTSTTSRTHIPMATHLLGQLWEWLAGGKVLEPLGGNLFAIPAQWNGKKVVFRDLEFLLLAVLDPSPPSSLILHLVHFEAILHQRERERGEGIQYIITEGEGGRVQLATTKEMRVR